jgi:glyoxylase-like metal-dependent hydrolase (beta-lactamase superfamily II)
MKAHTVYGIFLSAMVAGASGAAAQTANQNSVQIVSRSVGNIEVHLIAEGMRRGSPPNFVNADDTVIKQYIPDGTVDAEVNMIVFKTKEGVIVIDTGFGAGIIAGLQQLAIDPKSVTAVLLTHTHGDHIGGLLQNGAAVFPNAAIYLSAKELDFWNKNRGSEYTKAYKTIKVFEPAALGSKGKALFTGVTPFAAYGHTPGHTVFIIESNGQKLLVAGDLINVPAVQIPRPDIATVYDSDAQAASASRKRVLEYAAKNAITFSGMHMVFPAIGSITQNESGFSFTPAK